MSSAPPDNEGRLIEDLPYPAPRLRPISTSGCTELLAAHHVGRVAWSAATGPQMLPVSYAWTLGLIAFRTSPYGLLSQLVHPTEVVFEVDELDQEHRTGWSVVVHGVARAIINQAQLTQLGSEDQVAPWAGGIRNLYIGVEPRTLSGRVYDRDV